MLTPLEQLLTKKELLQRGDKSAVLFKAVARIVGGLLSVFFSSVFSSSILPPLTMHFFFNHTHPYLRLKPEGCSKFSLKWFILNAFTSLILREGERPTCAWARAAAVPAP